MHAVGIWQALHWTYSYITRKDKITHNWYSHSDRNRERPKTTWKITVEIDIKGARLTSSVIKGLAEGRVLEEICVYPYVSPRNKANNDDDHDVFG